MKLLFEQTWDRTISHQDRTLIEQIFEYCNKDVCYTHIRTAMNYKNEQLVTLLVHNTTDYTITFQERFVRFGDFEGIFTIPKLTIPPYTSMPWTFIFKS
ncbi:SLAP domain-containing protein [Kurthia gibsonii]|uniref:SLAP domain-containing protein n=1 Tax=Kurthia gibsonii TaxID=33946 RepID=UPI0031B683AF